MDCSIPGFPVLHCPLEFAQTHVHWFSVAIQPAHPLSSPSPFAFHLSQHQGVFQWVGSSQQVAKVLELQLSPSSEYSVLISFSIDRFDLLAVQGTLKSFFQHYTLKASILCCSVLFMFQLSYLYMTTEKAITLTIWTFVNKVTSLLFNMLFKCKQGN